jgi:hypothetical protein
MTNPLFAGFSLVLNISQYQMSYYSVIPCSDTLSSYPAYGR